jgi:D-alanyl-D-alanine endopeptidase (penicillin-binding protein 7)
LIASDNSAAANLCTAFVTKKTKKPSKFPCVAAMNAKAKSLGMTHTKFVEPTGLSEKNISTAEDLLKLVIAAAKYEPVLEASKLSFREIKTQKTMISIKNTNSLVGQYDVNVSKTGWTRAAGGCLVMSVMTNHEEKIIIILGSKSVRTRITEADQLIKSIEDSHPTLETVINTNTNRESQ